MSGAIIGAIGCLLHLARVYAAFQAGAWAGCKGVLLETFRTEEVLERCAKLHDAIIGIDDTFQELSGGGLDTAQFSDALAPALAQAGLKLKQSHKMKPRLIVNDVPLEVKREDLAAYVLQHNLQEALVDDVSVIYEYAAGSGKVSVYWSMCRIKDQVTVLQCYECADFGHVAVACKSKARCGHCSGEHESKDCCDRSNLKCPNCATADRGAFSAFDNPAQNNRSQNFEHGVWSVTATL